MLIPPESNTIKLLTWYCSMKTSTKASNYITALAIIKQNQHINAITLQTKENCEGKNAQLNMKITLTVI